jgi:hypothetical protein
MKMKGFPGWLALADESCCYSFPFQSFKNCYVSPEAVF